MAQRESDEEDFHGFNVLSPEENDFHGFDIIRRKMSGSDSGVSSIDFNNGSDSSNLNNGSETSESDLEPMDSIELEMIKIHEGYVDQNENKIVHNCLVILENKNQQQIDTLLRDHFNVEEYNKYFNASRDVVFKHKTVNINDGIDFWSRPGWQPKVRIQLFASVEEMVASANFRKRQQHRIKLNRYSGGRKIITPAKFRQPTEVQRSRTTGSILKRKLPEPSNKIRTKIAKHCANVLVEQDSEDLEEDSEDPEDLMDSEENFETDCLYRLDSLEVEDVQEMTKKHNLVFGGPKKDMLKLTAKIIARRTFATKRQMLVRWFPVDCKESLFSDELIEYEGREKVCLKKLVPLSELNHEQKCYLYEKMKMTEESEED